MHAPGASLRYDQTAATRANEVGNDFLSNVRNASHAAETTRETISMSYGAIQKTLGERVSHSLKRRLFPNTSLTRKQLQHALRISTGTMDNLLSGNHDPSGRILDKLVQFFRDSFINEIWSASNIHCIDTRAPERAAAVALVITAQAELRRLG